MISTTKPPNGRTLTVTALAITGPTKTGTTPVKAIGRVNGLPMHTCPMQVRLILITMAMKTKTSMMQKKVKAGMLALLCMEPAAKTEAVALTTMETVTRTQHPIGMRMMAQMNSLVHQLNGKMRT
jgi:hypothetical protein